MPLDKRYQIGKDAALYYGTAWATPSWTHIADAQDVTLTVNQNKVDLSRRSGGGWKGKGAGLKELSLEFGYLMTGGSDTVFNALRAAFLAATPLVFFVSDRVIAETSSSINCEGFRFPALLFDFPLSQALEEGINVKLGAEFSPVKEGSTVLIPEWYTTAGLVS